jgi:hypothetical protein
MIERRATLFKLEMVLGKPRLEFSRQADVAELVDAHGSGPCGGNPVEVQVLSSALAWWEAGRLGLSTRSHACYSGSAASTSAACVSGFTRRIAFVTLPSESITKVERSIPIDVLPYSFRSFQTP